MAFQTLFVDGFDHLLTADLGAKYDVINNGASISVQATTVRTGGKALQFATGSSERYVAKSLNMNARTVVVGLALYVSSTPTGSTSSIHPCILKLLADGSSQLALSTTASNQLKLSLSSPAGTLLGTSSILPTGQWSYVELRVYIDDTAGEWEIRINGATDVSGSGVDTKFSTSRDYINEVQIGAVHSAASFVDDFYIRGDTVLTGGGFFGDSKVITRYPQANGTYAQLTATGAASNYEAVDEATPNQDTDYVESATVGQRDTYDFQALNAGSVLVRAVQLNAYAKKLDAGDRSIKPYVKSGATEVAETAQALSTEYRFKTKVWDNDPATGAAWGESDLNAAEWGIEIA